ncbi:hypothetical protein ABFV05_015611 [Capra hircus]
MAESEEELKSLLMKVKEESGKVGLKLSIQKTKIMASSPITSRQIDGETMETKIREVADGLCLDVEGKMVSRTEGNIDDSLIGGNASAEGPEGEGVDIVMNHNLQETSFTKEAYKKYIKDYMKSVKGKLEEQRPERVKPFMTGAAEQVKHILANSKTISSLLVKT